MPSEYCKVLKQFTKEGFEDIIKKSNYKSECLKEIKKYSGRNSKNTCLSWIKRFGLLDEYNKLPMNYKKGVDNGKSLNQDEIDYWQSIADKSNSFEEMYNLHKISNSNFPKRSKSVFRKYLISSFILSSDESKEKRRQERIDKTNKVVESLSFIKEVISLDYSTHNTKISYICKRGHFQPLIRLGNHKKCSTCSSEKRKQKTIERRIQREQEEKEQRNLSKEKKISDRLKRVDEFFQNSKWKNFERVMDWPIKSDINYLKKCNKFEHETEYNQINYFEYKTQLSKPPFEPKENHKWCRYCREEKHSDNFLKRGYICKPCREEYRKEYFAEKEKEKNKQKYWSDPAIRLQRIISCHVRAALKELNTLKDKHFKEYVGLTREELRNWIESLMTEKMTWDNYGTYWVIQHIIPRAWKETIDDVYKLNYYKNLIPYEFSPNASLLDNIILSQLNDYHFTDKRMQYFLDKAWNEDRLYENVKVTPSHHILDKEVVGIKKVEMNYQTWQEWRWKTIFN